MSKDVICKTCGAVGQPRVHTPGHIGWEIVFWCTVVLGPIYSIWRHAARKKVCRSCGSAEFVPLDTPVGQQLQAQYAQDRR